MMLKIRNETRAPRADARNFEEKYTVARNWATWCVLSNGLHCTTARNMNKNFVNKKLDSEVSIRNAIRIRKPLRN